MSTTKEVKPTPAQLDLLRRIGRKVWGKSAFDLNQAGDVFDLEMAGLLEEVAYVNRKWQPVTERYTGSGMRATAAGREVAKKYAEEAQKR